MINLPKTFDYVPDDLLIAKRHAYGIKEGSFNLPFFYLKNKKQRVRLNKTYSEWVDILFIVLQGSILSPLLLNIFLYDFLLFIHEIPVASYADSKMPHCTDSKVQMF